MRIEDIYPPKPMSRKLLAFLHWKIQVLLFKRQVYVWGLTIEAWFQSSQPDVDGWSDVHVGIVVPPQWKYAYLKLTDPTVTFKYYLNSAEVDKHPFHTQLWDMNRICHGGCIASGTA